MVGGIWVCEFDGLVGDDILRERAAQLQLPPERDREARSVPEDHGPEGVPGDRGAEPMREKTRQHILAWMLLARAAGELWGLTPAQLEIRRDSGGKPCSAAHPELQFNLSHCNAACACIVGDTAVGIDIERKFRYRESLVKRFCHPKEYERLAEMDEPLRETQIHFLWSLKESFVKQDGRGLGYGMERVSFAPLLPIRLEPGAVFRCEYGGDELFLGDCGSYTLAACVDLSGAAGADRPAGARSPEDYVSVGQRSLAGGVPAGVRGSRDGVPASLRGLKDGVLAGVCGSADSVLAEGITWQRTEIHRLTERELVYGRGVGGGQAFYGDQKGGAQGSAGASCHL